MHRDVLSPLECAYGSDDFRMRRDGRPDLSERALGTEWFWGPTAGPHG